MWPDRPYSERRLFDMIPPLPEIDRASDQGAILSDNYPQVVTGVGGCQAHASEIRIGRGSEIGVRGGISDGTHPAFVFVWGKGLRCATAKARILRLAECADTCPWL